MIASVILTHQSPKHVEIMCGYWQTLFPDVFLVVAYGGARENYDLIDYADKIYVDDDRLRTKDHQREYQSYTGVFEAANRYLGDKQCDYVYFTEFDHMPLRGDFITLLLDVMKETEADVLMRNTQRVDGTGHAHHLYHLGTDGFLEMLEGISLRSNKAVVLSSFGFGQLWTMEAFNAVASVKEHAPCYLELWLPTVAHHLGYRVKSWDIYPEFHGVDGDRMDDISYAITQRAWALHPVKSIWQESSLIKKTLQMINCEYQR